MITKTTKRLRRLGFYIVFTSIMSLAAIAYRAMDMGGLPPGWDFLPMFSFITVVMFPLIVVLFNLHRVLDPIVSWCFYEEDLVPVAKNATPNHETNNSNFQEGKDETE